MAKRKTHRVRTKNYDIFLRKQLRERAFAAEYLSEALRDGDVETFLFALRNVADAHGGIGALATVTKLSRTSMYKMFSERGNPTVASLVTVLDAVGINLSFVARARKAA